MATPVLMIDTLQKNALDAGFAAAFGGEPTRYFSAPGRTEIGGNHTDHQRGRVLAAAVNLDTVAAVRVNGTDVIRIRGVQTLHKATYAVIPDQIETGTLMIAAAATRGDVTIRGCIPTHMEALTAKLLEMGVHRLFISMGADGVLAAMGDEKVQLSNLSGHMVNTTGCGDAFMAALVWAYLEGTDLKNTALAGLAAGSIAMESTETINPAMSATALKTRMGM